MTFMNSTQCPITTQNIVRNRSACIGRRSFDIWLSDLDMSLYQFRGMEKDTTTVESINGKFVMAAKLD